MDGCSLSRGLSCSLLGHLPWNSCQPSSLWLDIALVRLAPPAPQSLDHCITDPCRCCCRGRSYPEAMSGVSFAAHSPSLQRCFYFPNKTCLRQWLARPVLKQGSLLATRQNHESQHRRHRTQFIARTAHNQGATLPGLVCLGSLGLVTLSVATSCQLRWVPGLKPPVEGMVSSPDLMKPKKARVAAAQSIFASTPPGETLQLARRTSSTSTVIGFLRLYVLPCSALNLCTPRTTCPSFAIALMPGSPRPASTCICLTAAKYVFILLCLKPSPARNATNWQRPLSDAGRGVLPYLSQNFKYLRRATPYMRSVVGAIPFRKSSSTVSSNPDFCLPAAPELPPATPPRPVLLASAPSVDAGRMHDLACVWTTGPLPRCLHPSHVQPTSGWLTWPPRKTGTS